MWQNLSTWQKTFDRELLRAAEANQINQAMWNSKNLSYGQTKPDQIQKDPSDQPQPANQRPTLTWPNLTELVFELGGIERLLVRKAFSLLLLLTPGKALLCFSLISGPSAQVQSSLRWESCLENLPQCHSISGGVSFLSIVKAKWKQRIILTRYVFP